MELFEAIRTRRSIRRFESRPVARETVERLIEAAIWAPTACNQQLWRFVCVDDPALLDRLVAEAGSSTLVRRAPLAIVVTYQDNGTREIHQNGSAAIQNILLAARGLGLGALWLNSYGNETRIKEMLGLPRDRKIVSFVLVGHPASTPPPPKRRPVEQVMHWNAFHEGASVSDYSHDPARWTLASLRDYQSQVSRKTEAGATMDVFHRIEAALAGEVLRDGAAGRTLVVFPYDGSLLAALDWGGAAPETVELTRESADYTAAALGARRVASMLMAEDGTIPAPDGRYDRIAILFRLERLDPAARRALLKECRRLLVENGRLVIVARNRTLIGRLMMALIRRFSGDDIRKSAIFSFFGPYELIGAREVARSLRELGYRAITWKGRFLLPPLGGALFRLLIQYVKSGGNNFLHRQEADNVAPRLVDSLLAGPANAFGRNVVVIEAGK